MRRAALVVAACFASVTSAQSAVVAVSHDDPDGIVDPGQSVRISVQVAWTQNRVLGGLTGDVVASPDAGMAQNPVNLLQGSWPASPAFHPGNPVLGSIRGYSAYVHPGSTSVPPGFLQWSGADALEFDWIAPGLSGAGEYSFGFEFTPPSAGVYLYPVLIGSEPPVLVPTTVIPATLTVVPAPASIGAMALAGLALPGRRRRPDR
ncbi:MAG: hypothetical protein R3B68_12840 [Phycisphaerales bacterium]